MNDTTTSTSRPWIGILLGLMLLAPAQESFSAAARGAIDLNSDEDLVPTGRGWGERPDTLHQESAPDMGAAGAPGSAVVTGNGISYHGGPVMSSPVNIYYIWYGARWAGNTALPILTDLGNFIKGSPYFNINTTYGDSTGYVLNSAGSTPSPVLAGQVNSTYPYKTKLKDSDIYNIVNTAINSQGLGSDPDGVYFVLTSKEISETSGFCTRYCGWHTHASFAGTDIKYSFVGNPDKCPNACEAQSTSSPNGNPGADGMASIIAHELEEAATDPDLNAWYDSSGYENADKCAWKFGTTFTASNGSKYNVTLPDPTNTKPDRQYLIQQNWVNAGGGYCSMSY